VAGRCEGRGDAGGKRMVDVGDDGCRDWAEGEGELGGKD
jgi:hypothetical protein